MIHMETIRNIIEILKHREEQVSSSDAYLIAGLGNPGREYRHNRHNVGFMLVDRLAEISKIKLGKVQSKAIIGFGKWEQIPLLLVKPQTFMNLSGESISSLLRYYKIGVDNLLIVHDDLDLPLGTIRIRAEGGAGGQKGMASIIARLKTQSFARIRIGIGRPPGRMQAADYVLEDFLPSERVILDDVLDKTSEAIRVFLNEGIDQAMTRFNNRPKKA